jgi:SAM-dependent methyltransferase
MADSSKDGMFKVETVPCPLCGSREFTGFLKDVPERYNGTGHLFDIVRCCQCGFCYTNPRPRKEDIGYFYPDTAGYYLNKPAANEIKERFVGIAGFCKRLVLSKSFGYHHLLPSCSWVPAFLFKPWCVLARDVQVPCFCEGGRLLEIGCSTGGYLKKMALLGWQVTGVELNAAAAQHAREHLGLNDVRTGFFEDFSFPSDSFQAVKASMVLEHVFNPRGFVRRVHQTLASGGEFIFSIPDVNGVEVKWFGRNTYCLHVPQHLNHFSGRTIASLLKEEGFDVMRISHHAFDRDLVASADYAGRTFLARVLHNFLVRRLLVQPFVWLLAIFGKTSRMTVYARKR